MGVLSNRAKREDLKTGDHIYTWRTAYLYAHHGICAGKGLVIHFTRGAGQEIGTGTVLDRIIISSCPSRPLDNPCPTCGDQPRQDGVILSCIDCFLSGGELYVFEYGVSPVLFIAKARGGTCTIAASDPPEDVLHRAFFLLENGFGVYCLFKNNCEDFAMYCKTGLLVSTSVGRSGQASSIFAAANTVITSTVRYFTTSFGVLMPMNYGMYCASRFVSDIGVRQDVEKIPVERLISLASFDKSEATTSGTIEESHQERRFSRTIQLPQISEKLNSNNYLLWKAQIEPQLWSIDLYGHVDGSTPIPEKYQSTTTADAQPRPNPDYLKWLKDDKRVQTVVNASLSSSVLPQVVGCATAREVWDRLYKAYGTGSRSQMLCLKQDLSVLTKGSDNIDAYLLRVKSIVYQLAALGQPVSNDDIVQKILFGLDETYGPFARNIEARGEAIPLDELHGLLKIEETNLRRLTAAQPLSLFPTVNNAARGRGRRGGRGHHRGGGRRSGRGGNGPNFSTNQINGTQAQQCSRRQYSGNGSSLVLEEDVQCFNCSGYGHLARNCSSARRTGTSRSGPLRAHHTTSPQGSSSPWVLDSGTTHHLTSDLSNLQMHSEYNGPEEVTFGHEADPVPRPK